MVSSGWNVPNKDVSRWRSSAERLGQERSTRTVQKRLAATEAIITSCDLILP